MDEGETPRVEPRREREPSTPAIELRHLRYFIAVFEELHFGHAAERLHISQPPLSQAIRRLEDELGVPLLERTSRVVNPTEAGRVFAEEARTVLAAMDGAVTEARRAAGAHTAIRIGCASDLPIRRLARFLIALKRRESTRFVTHLLSREELVAGLRRGEFDLAIIPGDGEEHEIETEPLSPDRRMVALLSPEHPLASGEAPLGPDSLKAELLLLLPRAADPAVHDRLRMAMEESGFRFRAIHEVAGTNARDLLLAVAQNAGVALTPDTYMELTESDIVVARPLDPQPALSPLVVAWPVNHRPWLEDVIRSAQAVARELRTLQA